MASLNDRRAAERERQRERWGFVAGIQPETGRWVGGTMVEMSAEAKRRARAEVAAEEGIAVPYVGGRMAGQSVALFPPAGRDRLRNPPRGEQRYRDLNGRELTEKEGMEIISRMKQIRRDVMRDDQRLYVLTFTQRTQKWTYEYHTRWSAVLGRG